MVGEGRVQRGGGDEQRAESKAGHHGGTLHHLRLLHSAGPHHPHVGEGRQLPVADMQGHDGQESHGGVNRPLCGDVIILTSGRAVNSLWPICKAMMARRATEV